jgi:hypothetical protein
MGVAVEGKGALCGLPTLSILSSQPFEPCSLFGGLSGPFLQRAAAKTTAQV